MTGVDGQPSQWRHLSEYPTTPRRDWYAIALIVVNLETNLFNKVKVEHYQTCLKCETCYLMDHRAAMVKLLAGADRLKLTAVCHLHRQQSTLEVKFVQSNNGCATLGSPIQWKIADSSRDRRVRAGQAGPRTWTTKIGRVGSSEVVESALNTQITRKNYFWILRQGLPFFNWRIFGNPKSFPWKAVSVFSIQMSRRLNLEPRTHHHRVKQEVTLGIEGKLECVEKFNYLGDMTEAGGAEEAIKARMRNA